MREWREGGKVEEERENVGRRKRRDKIAGVE
jgi:hypothetical protein